MAWFYLTVTGKDELTDDDRIHIAELVQDGYTEGQLLEGEE